MEEEEEKDGEEEEGRGGVASRGGVEANEGGKTDTQLPRLA